MAQARGMQNMKTCVYPGCTRFMQSRDLCMNHYEKFAREVKLGRASWKALEASGYGTFEVDGKPWALFEYVFGAATREAALEIAYNIINAEKVKPGLDTPEMKPMSRNDARKFVVHWAELHGTNVLIPLVNRSFAKPNARGSRSYFLGVFGEKDAKTH